VSDRWSTLAATFRRQLSDGIQAGRFSGAACALAVAGEAAVELYLGTQAAWCGELEPISVDEQRPVTANTLFDLASVTKVFTAHTALSLADAGVVDLDAPIAAVLPAYRDGERSRVTLRHLLNHTSGLPPEWNGWRGPLARRLEGVAATERLTATPLAERDVLIADLLGTPLEAPVGTRFTYSCANYNTTMAYLEAVTGRPWRDLVADYTLDPLGLSGVTADPEPALTAATEYQPGLNRGVVTGVVHDEAAWSLGGGAGNAGLFATARGLLHFTEQLRTDSGRVLGRWMWDDALTRPLGRATASPEGGFGSSLGLRIGDPEFMGSTATMHGHTGFTGTSLLVDRETGVSLVLLTNRIHPSRDLGSIQPLRAALADLAVAAARAR
jgi:CubicO group peptidase (beta-lactamase class C family)